VNDFNFKEGVDTTDPQLRCPFAAHVRKTNPRSDLEVGDLTGAGPNPNALDNRRIMRRGIPFGPEVTKEEEETHTTCVERGLLFVAYQSNLANGFQFIQHSKIFSLEI
jgi:deferrochelatase/peroxidase EfeB